jgi:hypothetical protein
VRRPHIGPGDHDTLPPPSWLEWALLALALVLALAALSIGDGRGPELFMVGDLVRG